MKVIVSHEHRFAYFVVPKVACTSIKSALLPAFGFDDTGYWFQARQPWQELRVHKLYVDNGVELYRRDLAEAWRDRLRLYFTFAFVRNPWDRLVSCWYQKLSNPLIEKVELKQPGDAALRFRPRMGFEEFAEAVTRIPDREADPHFRSQHTQVSAPWDGSLTLPSFVGRFERLADDFAEVAATLGFDERLELPHKLRVERRTTYRDHYTPQLRDLVAERYAEDVARFGYEF